MPKVELSKLPVVGHMKDGETPKEHFIDIYKAIGKYFIDQAEILAGDVDERISSVYLSIDLSPHELVTIDKQTKHIVKGK